MDKSNNPSNEEEISIKIKLLDIFPSINDLKQQKDEIDIVFQGLDTFFNLLDLLIKKDEITLKIKKKKSIIISLIKSNILFATCLFNIKQGEQWISFTYENKKKKDTSLAQSLIDCIKIKINCEIFKNSVINNNIIFNSKKSKYNNLTNNPKSNYGSLLTEDNNHKNHPNLESNYHKIKINNKILTNRGYKKISLDSSPKDKFLNKIKFSSIKNNNSININSSKNQLSNIIDKKKYLKDDFKITNKERGLRRMKTKNSYSKIIDEDLVNKLNKMFNKNEDNKLNLTHRNPKINNKLDLSTKSKKNFNFSNNKTNLLFSNFGSTSNQKNKNYIKGNFLYNPNNKTEIKYITHEYNNKRNEPEISLNNINNSGSINNDINISKIKKRKYKENNQNLNFKETKHVVGILTNRRNKDVIKDLKNITSTNAKTPDITKINKFNTKSAYQNTVESEKFILNKDKENKDNSIYKNNSSDFDIDNDEENKIINNLSNSSYDDYSNYLKLREDFILLYNENYVKNVQEDLLKLEIELFVEKMTGLIEAYHQEINEKKIENKIIENDLKKNSEKYINLCKLYYKLNLIKKKYKKKDLKLLKNKSNIKEMNEKNFDTNKKELKLFKLIFPYKKENKSRNKINISGNKLELKNIINIILNNTKNKKIINTNINNNGEKEKKDEFNNSLSKNENISKSIYNDNTFIIRPKARVKAIPKFKKIKFNSKEINSLISNKNKSERKIFINNKNGESNIYNSFTHNPNINVNIYNKNSEAYSLNPNKFYSRKIPK